VPILRKILRDLRGPTLGFGLCGAVMAVLVVVLYPSIREQLQDFEYPTELGRAFGFDLTNLGDPRVFFSAEYFSWMPLLLLVYMYRAASAHLAGEEEDGTLDLLLAQPVSRTRVFLETIGALALGALGVCAISAVGFVLAWPAGDVEGLSLAEIVGVCFLIFPFLLTIAALTLLAGATASSRGWSTGGTLGLLVAVYLLFIISGLDDDLRWLQYLTPFYYAGLPTALTEGVDAWRVIILVVATVVMLGLALLAFTRRDLRSGESPLSPVWRALTGREAGGQPRV
jgi:ABC-2 type transport system permease protein